MYVTTTPHRHVPASWLFVPGSRPDRFEKAAGAGTHEVIVDLEDAVAQPRLRRQAMRASAPGPGRQPRIRAELGCARKILANGSGDAFAVDGEMVDRPVIQRAGRIIPRARQTAQ